MPVAGGEEALRGGGGRSGIARGCAVIVCWWPKGGGIAVGGVCRWCRSGSGWDGGGCGTYGGKGCSGCHWLLLERVRLLGGRIFGMFSSIFVS
jgi:hypothetical protein